MIVQWLGKVECKSLTGFLNLLPGHNRVWRSFLSWNATSLITRMKNIRGMDWFFASPFLIIISFHISFLVLPVFLWRFVDYILFTFRLFKDFITSMNYLFGKFWTKFYFDRHFLRYLLKHVLNGNSWQVCVFEYLNILCLNNYNTCNVACRILQNIWQQYILSVVHVENVAYIKVQPHLVDFLIHG